ncbi:MAG: hypothetical protein C0423_14570 [Methylibium sp.]|nr:hypothetical protein [Methylibium sp.]
MSKIFRLFALGALASVAATAQASLSYDQNVTSNVIAGTGIGNGGFTVDKANGLEIGLRARVRYPSPTNVTNSNGNGSYNHAVGGFGPGNARASWNFDWSINTGTAAISAYTYRIGIDYDAGLGTNYRVFDPLNSVNPNPAAGGLALWDHSFGNSGTAQGAGVEATGVDLATFLASYNALESSNSLVQNSWNLAFYSDASHLFDPNLNGNYSIYLEAFNANGGLLARSEIDVIVGTGTVPEPGSLVLALGALGGLLLAARRRRR